MRKQKSVITNDQSYTRNDTDLKVNKLEEKLRLYLKNLDGAFSKLVPLSLSGVDSSTDIAKLKDDFKKAINTFYKQHGMAVELAEGKKKGFVD